MGRMNKLVACFGIALACAGCVTAPSAPAYDTLISHRGESYDAPENTMPAYRMAVERGFGFECDVYLSQDNRVFAFHDATLTRTSGGRLNKKCIEANWDNEVSVLNVGGWGKWKGTKFDPTHPALLEDVCTLARDGRWIYCEVKSGSGVKIVPHIREILAKQQQATPKNFLFISFSQEICAELKRVMPEYRVYWLTGGKTSAEKILETLKACRADGVDVKFNLELHDAAFIRAIHDAGYSFHVWTIDDPAMAAKAFARGVDTLTTNRAKFILDSVTAK